MFTYQRSPNLFFFSSADYSTGFEIELSLRGSQGVGSYFPSPSPSPQHLHISFLKHLSWITSISQHASRFLSSGLRWLYFLLSTSSDGIQSSSNTRPCQRATPLQLVSPSLFLHSSLQPLSPQGLTVLHPDWLS